MAWMPSQKTGLPLRLLCVAIGCATLTGCEVGRTMFQHSSGQSSPWIGIDLLPRRKEVSAINHVEPKSDRDSQTPSRSVTLAAEETKPAKKFGKKPIRLDLPASEAAAKPATLVHTEDVEFSVSSMRFRSF
ncbi:hypothetical protein [Rubinisphaera margarita]|uniref:hypothetical protein n=1 Tax=Rubinisphaera margarita TaxID=2909586 RepID=UPI001EE9A873|nr:hypothetical protein [Rubinisphaera margarita]MCG6157312.1 hypothetical protein [Rubinisphaera margarita]